MQITRYLDVNPNAKPGDVLKWVLSHSPNPLPQATTNSITKLVPRIRVEQFIEYQNPLNRDRPSIDVADSTHITNIDEIRQLLSEVSKVERNMVASELGSQGYGIFGGVISALKTLFTTVQRMFLTMRPSEARSSARAVDRMLPSKRSRKCWEYMATETI